MKLSFTTTPLWMRFANTRTQNVVPQISLVIPQLAPYKLALPLDVKPKCSLLVGPFSLVS